MGFPRASLSTLNKSPSDSWLHPVHPIDENILVGMPEGIMILRLLQFMFAVKLTNEYV
jgi:hypothetical protein